MLSPLDPASQMFTADLDKIGDRIARANQQISSGIRIGTASDDPGAVGDILDLQSEIGRASQIQSNLSGVKAEVDSADSSLQSAVALMDRARTIATMGATTTYGTADRQSMAVEVGNILQSMVGLANTTVNGRYIFGGDTDGTAPYQYDPATGTAVASPTLVASTRLIEAPDGSTFQVAHNAGEIFDADPVNGVFASLAALQQALATGDSTTVSGVTGALTSASDGLNAQLTFYGAAENNLQSATDEASKRRTALKAELSEARDTDIPSAALELQQATLNQQAALSSFSNRPRQSLFDYLG